VNRLFFRRRIFEGIILLSLAFLWQPECSLADTGHLPPVPIPGMVTMVDLGAKKCIPCKMMAPILEELQSEYRERAAVIFIDVWENPEAAPRFSVRAIPTQIFYDVQGKEVTRHEGFLDKQSIVSMFAKLGVQ
jgi:thioredoxin 1